MGIKERRTREKERLRQKMLDAAARILSEKGYSSLSIRKIAARIDYSPALIYHYFKDKSDIINQLVDDSFKKFLDKMEDFPREVTDNPLEKLKAITRSLIEFGAKNPNHYKAVFVQSLVTDNDGSYFTESAKREEGFVLLVRTIENAVNKSLVKDVDVISASETIWSSVHGIVLHLISQENMPSFKRDRLINTYTDMIVNGIGKTIE